MTDDVGREHVPPVKAVRSIDGRAMPLFRSRSQPQDHEGFIASPRSWSVGANKCLTSFSLRRRFVEIS
jgi:hypothetical protein